MFRYRILIALFFIVTITASVFLAKMPMEMQVSLSLAIVLISVMVWLLNHNSGVRLPLMILSSVTAIRYIVWRVLETLNFHGAGDTTVSLALFAAECYSIVMMIGFYIHTFRLDRSNETIPDDPSFRPTVDVFITTYDENADILRRTACGALAIDYSPKEVYILDDGNRAEIKQLAADIGCHYIARKENVHAKAGNINNAMTHTKGDLILFLDADHIPVNTFLKRMVHFFKDPKVALVQTPHRFLNPGPVERNLYMEEVLPGEQQLFYQVVQVGKNHWNASFFCGSAGIMRRTALEEVGGVGTETVTEDCETSIKLHGLGYKSIYCGVPQVASLSPESMAGYIIQQTRWARGSMQLLRLYNPLTYPGLTLGQRFCYIHGLSHYFFGGPRIIYYLAPLAFIFFNLRPVSIPFIDYMLMALPYLLLSILVNNRIFSKYRYTFWSDVYDACVAPFVFMASTLGLFAPKTGKFVVTPKGCQTNHVLFDLGLAWPHLLLSLLCFCGLITGTLRYTYTADSTLKDALMVNLFWCFYNFMIILAATLASVERPHTRRAHRVTKQLPASLTVDSNKKQYAAHSVDLTEFGALVAVSEPNAIAQTGQEVKFSLAVPGEKHHDVTGIVRRVRLSQRYAQLVAVDFTDRSPATLKKIIPAIYCEPGIWEYFKEGEDNIVKSLERVLTTPFRWTRYTLPKNWMTRIGRFLGGAKSPDQLIAEDSEPRKIS